MWMGAYFKDISLLSYTPLLLLEWLVMVLPDCSTYHPSQRGAAGPVAAVLAAGPAYPDVGTREPQEEARAAYLYKQSKL